jgi:D-alanyl-D-alanine carboxypeptidase (penicillin-binding protein 5/6)
MMNRRARQLGLRHTHYSTPIGFDTPGNYSSASDLVKLASYLLTTYPFFARAVDLPSAVLHTGNHPRVIINRNDLVARFSWITGVKTGHTLAAGYVLVASARQHRMTLLSAVLGTSSEAARDANTLALLDYGYAAFRLVKPVRRDAVLARPSIKGQSGKWATAIAARGFSDAVPAGIRIRLEVEVPRQVVGPLPRHAVVGRVVVLGGRRVLARIPLLLGQALPAASPSPVATRIIAPASALVSVLVLLGLWIAVTVRRRERARTMGEDGAKSA